MKIFNKILSLTLILVFFLITAQNTVAYLYFKLNQNYIAKNLCVKKTSKDNYCLGNCYLQAIQKKLAQNETAHNQKAIPVKYTPGNSLQEYIIDSTFNFTKTEYVIFFSNKTKYKLLQNFHAPLTPPPKSNFFI